MITPIVICLRKDINFVYCKNKVNQLENIFNEDSNL